MIDDLTHWLRGSGLEIAMLVSAAVLAVRLVDVLARRASRRVVAGEDAVAARTRDAIVQAARYAATFAIASVTAVLVLMRLSIPLGSLVPVATVIGMGIGFGAQRIVADLLAGFFLFAERQFGVGDTIKVSSVGSESGIVGAVEEVSLRVTRLRRFDGDIVTIPNGELRQVSNMSRDWARLAVDVPISFDEDVDAVVARIDEVGRELADDPKWGPLILEVPKVSGVESSARTRCTCVCRAAPCPSGTGASPESCGTESRSRPRRTATRRRRGARTRRPSRDRPDHPGPPRVACAAAGASRHLGCPRRAGRISGHVLERATRPASEDDAGPRRRGAGDDHDRDAAEPRVTPGDDHHDDDHGTCRWYDRGDRPRARRGHPHPAGYRPVDDAAGDDRVDDHGPGPVLDDDHAAALDGEHHDDHRADHVGAAGGDEPAALRRAV